MSTHFIVGAKALGYHGLIASWRRPKPDDPLAPKWGPSMIISCAATTDEVVHEPAQSVTLNTRESLLALREAIDEALREDTQ